MPEQVVVCEERTRGKILNKKKELDTLGNMTCMIAEWLLIESDHVVSEGDRNEGRHDSSLFQKEKNKGYDNTSSARFPSLLSQSDMPIQIGPRSAPQLIK